MTEIRIPVSITYEVSGVTPVSKVIDGLRASEAAIKEAAGLLPSFLPDVAIQSISVGVQRISQQSPLREVLIAAIVLAQQEHMGEFIAPYAERIYGQAVTEPTSEMLGLLVSLVIVYGASAARDIVVGSVGGKVREQLKTLIKYTAQETGKSEKEITDILEARYSDVSLFKRLVRKSRDFFAPAHAERTSPVVIGNVSIPSDVVAEIPPSSPIKDKDMARYIPKDDVEIKLHAMDKDKQNTGWAAVIPSLSDRRIKLRIGKEVDKSDIWGKDTIRGDIVVVEKLTSYGFFPQEYQLTRVLGRD
uniref:hypothetical protein n=1 Tax=Paracoccus sp. TRP TaxID=412597 RepID=UPI000225F65A|nr:hypothetical protein [Paracoccus sp. TRP]